MTNINLAFYRAKKIDNDEYVTGWYSEPIIIEGELYLSITNKDGTFRIDTATLAICFPNMLDSQENAIFASLNGNGKGGSIIQDKQGKKGIVMFCTYENKPFVKGLNNEDKKIFDMFNNNADFAKYAKVIGIQK